MCKFVSADDQAYKDVLQVLQEYCGAAKEIETQRERERQEQERQEQERDEHRRRQDQAAFREQFDFGDRTAREQQLENAVEFHPPSLDWIWDSKFAAWLESKEDQLFWIAGKPASGKSTLVSYVSGHKRTHKLAAKTLGSDVAVARFFFDFRAKSGIANNFEGLRKSILFQLLGRFRIDESVMMNRLGIDPQGDLSRAQLVDIFRLILKDDNRPCLLFLDGLDEYAGQKPELVRLINEITKFNLKVCVSSRNEAPFSSAYGPLAWKLYMEQVNRPGIEAYARDVISDCWVTSTCEEKKVLDQVAWTVAENAYGVFLWARFAVSDIVKMLDVENNVEFSWINDIIHKMPQDLEQRYSRIFSLMDTKQRHTCGILLQLINAAIRPLWSHELLEAVLLAGVHFRSLDHLLGDENVRKFEKYLQHVTSGLVEIAANEGSRIRMIHRTLQTYLDKTHWKDFFVEQPDRGIQHVLWITVCERFFTGEGVKWDERCEPDESGVKDYAHEAILDHGKQYELETLQSSWSLLHHMMTPEWVEQHIEYDEGRIQDMLEFSDKLLLFGSDVQLAILYELEHYLEEALERSEELATLYTGSFSDLLFEDDQDGHTPARKERASLLATAVFVSQNWPYTYNMRPIIRLLVPLSPCLQDSDLLIAIGTLSAKEIKLLLTQRPPGRLLLHSKAPVHCTWPALYVLREVRQRLNLTSEYPFGPLWAVGAWFDYKPGGEGEAILRLFMARGEDINRPCGPYGTILHSVVLHWLFRSWEQQLHDSFQRAFNTIAGYCSDIHVRGMYGNVLEYMWMAIHSAPCIEIAALLDLTPLKLFISMGIGNSVCDPCGHVPSKERMLAVAKKYGLGPEDMSFYHYGTTARANEWKRVRYGSLVRVPTEEK